MTTNRTKAQCLEFRRKRQFLRFQKAFRTNRNLAEKFPHVSRADFDLHLSAGLLISLLSRCMPGRG